MPAKTINLLPRKDFDKTPLGRFLRWSLTYGRYIIICTEIIVLMAFIYRFSLDRQITDINEDIQQKQAIIEANQGFEEQFRNLQKRTLQIKQLFENQDLSLTILKHLEKITPEGILLTSFNFTKDHVNITAASTTNYDLALFLNNLKASPILTRVNIATIKRQSAGTGEIVFQIDAAIREQPILPFNPGAGGGR